MAPPQAPQGTPGTPVVPRVPGQFPAAAHRTQRSQRRVVLHHEGPPRPRRPLGKRSARHVQVQGTDHVETRRVGEQPELRAGPRIEVQQVVLARRTAATEVQVEHAPVAQLGHDPPGERRHPRVRRPASGRGQPGTARPGPRLASGPARADDPAPVGVPVDEPVPVPPRRQVRLQQQPAPRLPRAQGQFPGLPRRTHQHRAAQPAARRQQPRPAPLRHHRQPQPRGGPRGLRRGVRDHGPRVRHAQRGTDTRQFRLVGDVLGQGPGGRRQQVAGSQFPARAAHGHRPGVVHRHQHGRPPDPRRDPPQYRRDLGRGRAGRRRGVHRADVPGRGHGAARAVGDHVHLHARPAERAHGPQRPVVEGVPVDPQQYGGDTDVEQRHG